MNDRLAQLEKLISALRGPDGCPWDREQTITDLRAYLLEEAHETAAAIDTGDYHALAGELGDLLFQVVFIAELGKEAGAFDLTTVIERIHDKMIERHPHVFGDEELEDSAAVRSAWEKRKAANRDQSVLAGVPPSLPALLTAYRMTQKVAGVGFDWPDIESILAKTEEELDELRCELGTDDGVPNRQAIGEELGDLLFTICNLARRLEIDPELALAGANLKFKRRFQKVEERLRQTGGAVGSATTSELDALWNEVKKQEGPKSDG